MLFLHGFSYYPWALTNIHGKLQAVGGFSPMKFMTWYYEEVYST